MSKFSVKDIQFMSRDLCNGFQKELAYLWFVAKSRMLPGAPYQTVFRKYPLTNQSTREIINELIDSYKQELNVSSKCKYIVFVREFLETYYNYEEDLKELFVLPGYTVESTPISNIHDELPDNVCIWELNHIAPALTGMFYENMLNYILVHEDINGNSRKQLQKQMDKECRDLSTLLYGNQHNVSTNSIMSLLQRHFLDENIGKYSLMSPEVFDKQICLRDNDSHEKLSEQHFRNRYYYILWISFLHFLKVECKTSVIADVLKAAEYVSANMDVLNRYYRGLSKSTLVRTLMQKHNRLDIEHGTSFSSATIRGEVDFITPNSVIDIKCYKTDEIELWAGQLFLYMQLAQGTEGVNGTERNLTGGAIVNLFSNEIHTYKFDKRVMMWSEREVVREDIEEEDGENNGSGSSDDEIKPFEIDSDDLPPIE